MSWCGGHRMACEPEVPWVHLWQDVVIWTLSALSTRHEIQSDFFRIWCLYKFLSQPQDCVVFVFCIFVFLTFIDLNFDQWIYALFTQFFTVSFAWMKPHILYQKKKVYYAKIFQNILHFLVFCWTSCDLFSMCVLTV